MVRCVMLARCGGMRFRGRMTLKKFAMAFVCLAAVSLSGCVALLAGAAGGATAVACTEDEIDCPVD